MSQVFREKVIVSSGGRIEIQRPDLPEGAAAEVVVTIESEQPEPLPLALLLGKARSGYTSGEEADAFLRAERDAWDR
jgi:hypothetical protein